MSLEFNKAKRIIYNFIFGLTISALFIALEYAFRLNKVSLVDYLRPSDYLAIILLFTIVSFLDNKTVKITLVLISSIFIIQVGHFNYFGYFLFPMEFILFFTKSNEIFETLITRLDIFIEPIVFAIILLISTFRLLNYTDIRLTYNKFKYIFLLLLMIPIINTGIHYKERTLGERPNGDKSIIKNSLYVTKSFFGKTLPLYIFDIQVVDKWVDAPQYNKNTNHKIDNVILIVGESLSLHYMSLYGYEKPTTHKLDELSKSYHNFYVSKALSSGVFTDTSIPMVLNIAKKPNALEHILSNKSNLFKMAKDNKFNTYWISSQAKDGFSYIRNYMGVHYIDYYKDASNFGFDKYTSGLDNIIYESLKNIDLNHSHNFIVLNMIGSHSPYAKRVPDSFKPFGSKNVLNHYENTLAYTDKIISDIIVYLKHKTKAKTLLIFTSDHGQSVSKNGYGHGNIKNKKHYEVPLLLFSNNFELDKNIRKIMNNKYISHYTMSQIVAHYLGYDSEKYMNTDKAYVIGNELSGNAGFIEYDIKSGKVKYK